MSRSLAFAFVVWSVPASAQMPVPGGGFRPSAPAFSAPFHRGGVHAALPMGSRPGIAGGRQHPQLEGMASRLPMGPHPGIAGGTRRIGGFYPLDPYSHGPSFHGGYGGYGGYGGGYIASRSYFPYYYYGMAGSAGSSSYYDDSGSPPPAPPAHFVQLSGEFPAAVTLEFPAPATVWLDGQEVPGLPDATRTITSPVLRPGSQFTFHIRARWEVKGKTYEYTRDATLATGDRSRILVVSGTVVTGK